MWYAISIPAAIVRFAPTEIAPIGANNKALLTSLNNQRIVRLGQWSDR